MSTEQPPTPQEKFYKKYIEKLNIFFKSLKTKILNQKSVENQQDQILSDNTIKE